MVKKILVVLFVTLLSTVNIKAQEELSEPDTSATNNHLTVEEVTYLIHSPLSDIIDTLSQKGYSLTDVEMEPLIDSSSNIVKVYKSVTFISLLDFDSYLWVYQSEDSLDNIIQFELPLQAETEWMLMMSDNAYSILLKDPVSTVFTGNTGGTTYRFNMRKTSSDRSPADTKMKILITGQNQDNIDSFNARQTAIKEKMVDDLLQEAQGKAGQHDYFGALAIVDSTKNLFEPKREEVLQTKGRLMRNAWNHYYPILQRSVNSQNSIEQSLRYCDTLETLFPESDTVKQIRAYLSQLQSGQYNRFSTLCPDAYSYICQELVKVVEKEIANQKNPMVQPLIVDFNFKTDSVNASWGKIYYDTEKYSSRTQRKYKVINDELQQEIDYIAKLPAIQPLSKNGINIVTQDAINATIRWETWNTVIVDSTTSQTRQYAPFIDSVISRYFTVRDTISDALTRSNGTMVNARVVKPSKLTYTFSTTEKKCNDEKFVDVSLVGFDTPGWASWMPSLILPGWGTKNQGKYHSAVGKALPFLLFGAIAGAGFWWEKGPGSDGRERPAFGDASPNNPLDYKNMGYYIGWGCASISAIIYITDIIEGISTASRNIRLSKKIKEDLKKQPVILQVEPISYKTESEE